ncbi:MAG: hypothetical protein EA401_09335 [Planctomycetota bacterium]|nr:MAG: hypothetical protein EA401_09335 [Planctomycetota bacterium]
MVTPRDMTMYNHCAHRHSISGRVDPNALMWIIALAVLTIVFALLAMSRAGEAETIMEGDPQHPRFTTTASLQNTRSRVNQLQAEIEDLRRRIEAKEAVMHSLDYTLSGLGAYYSNNPERPGWLIGGDQDVRGWRITQGVIAQRAAGLERWSQAYAAQDFHRFNHIDDIIGQFQNDQQRVLTTAADVQASFERDRESLMRQLDRYAEERREAQERQNFEFNSLATQRLRLDAEIRELLDLRLEWLSTLDADATVVRVDMDGRYLIIDRGAVDGILPGLQFEVFTFDRGDYVVKGLVEVVELGDHIATCRILEVEDPRHRALHPGDKVGNPVFNAAEPKTFVLAGEFSLFNRSDLENFIRQAGGRVRSELSPGVDYLVAGDRSEAIQDRAREFPVVAMDEATLVRYLNTTFVPE